MSASVSGQRFKRVNAGSGHSYLLDGRTVPGVTTVIGQLDKPALVNWAARETAAYADEHWARLSGMRSADRIRELEGARYQKNRAAVIKGNRLHALGQRLAQGEQVDAPAEIFPHVEAYARFLDQWGFETVATEVPVCRTDYRYAGTLDLIVESDRFGRVLLDVKTGKGVYAETALQTTAYRYCDLMLIEQERRGPRGGKLPSEWVEQPMPAVDRCMVAHVREDVVELVPLVSDRHLWAVFLHLLEIHETWARRIDFKHREDPAFSPVVGAPIYPEDKDEEGTPR